MRTYNGYEKVSVGNIPQKKLEKAILTGKLSLSADDLKGNRVMLLHPANAAKIKNAKSKSKGVQGMQISGGEIKNDLDWHNKAGGSMNGGSVWSFLKNAGKKVFNFVKDNWADIKPIVSKVADAAIPALATYVGQPSLGVAGREALRSLTGVGMKSDSMSEKMAKVRAAKKNKVNVLTAGSFKIN